MSLQFTLIGNEDGESNIVVFIPGSAPMVAHSTHPNFEAILDGAREGDESVSELFDVAATAAQKFERLSERITTANGRLYLDGEEINNTLAEQVLRFLDEGVNDWLPLVKFFENVQANPNEHSREQLFDWLSRRDFTITQDGMIVGYKSVQSSDDGFLSISSGKAIVDGEVIKGRIPNKIGSTIEMPRSEVQHDPSVGCHTGLHVGTYDYAKTFSGDTMLEVHVNPRDVVSVPTDSDWAKVRTCRYTVVNTITKPYTSAILYDREMDDYDGWGELDPDADEVCDVCGDPDCRW